MAVFPAYESYRSADISWLASVPSHWRATRLKRESQIQTGVTLGKVYAVEVESRPYLRVANVQAGFLDLRHIKYIEVPRSEALKSELRPNDVVLTEGGDIDKLGRGAIWSGQIKGCIHQNHIFAVRPDPTSLSPKFLTYILESPHGRSYFRVTAKQTTNLAATNRSTLGRLPLFLPPRPEQDQIVAYLRAQDAHIARFIRAKRELIQLLTEQKLAIIDRAVTRGLDPNVRLKPSGIDWLGEVPEHWEVVSIKHIADVRFSGVDKHSHDHETSVRLCNYTDVYKNDRITDDMDLMRATATAAEIARLTLKAGDVILTKDSETPDDIGVPAWVPEDLPGVVCAYHLGLLRPVPDRVLGEFLFRAIGSARTAKQFHVLATGVTRFALGKHDVKNAVIALPPVEEQQAICRWITEECQPLDDAIARTEEEIKLIREYRDRLIADVVTGQVDVRGWRPGPDDVASDEELAALGDGEADLDEEEPGEGGE